MPSDAAIQVAEPPLCSLAVDTITTEASCRLARVVLDDCLPLVGVRHILDGTKPGGRGAGKLLVTHVLPTAVMPYTAAAQPGSRTLAEEALLADGLGALSASTRAGALTPRTTT